MSARLSIRNIASLQTPVWLVVRTAPQSAAVPEAEGGRRDGTVLMMGAIACFRLPDGEHLAKSVHA